MIRADFLIAGAGVVGVCISRELKRRFPDAKVVVLEKEESAGQHASGRNSGVLHAGFYYSPNSLKARFTRMGNLAMQQFCDEYQLPIRRCGKLVAAVSADQLPTLNELFTRGMQNEVDLRLVSEIEAKEIEPRAVVFHSAIFSPTTASIDPKAVMAKLVACAVLEGVDFRYGEPFVRVKKGVVHSAKNAFSSGYFVNAAGLYADKIAHSFGHGARYRILPFRGRYLRSIEPAGSFRTHIYPVPDMAWPFLGVHCTVAVDGFMKIGPTAFPAFWREHYQGLSNFSLREMTQVCSRELQLLLESKFRFRELAWHELKSLGNAAMIARASKIAAGLSAESFSTRTAPGIRAQLLDIQTGKLEMDFIMEADGKSLHVLNAVSPAFTCAIPISQHVCDEVEQQLKYSRPQSENISSGSFSNSISEP